ncbi:MAG TPA: SDR family oxidoreductase [Kofleriaceae bacterium]|nr:SDR family oxidoreductase [Kofleriaceae bacterium]
MRPPILITGARGTLGGAFARMCRVRDLAFELTTRDALDIGDRRSVMEALERHQPWAVINAAGYVRVDDAEDDHHACMLANVDGPELLAEACASARLPFVTFSSDLVFDGAKETPYDERDLPRPLNVYGRSKLAAEQRVLDAHPGAMVVRTSAFFGPWDSHNFVTQTLCALREGRPVQAAHDAHVSPTYLPDLVNSSLDLLIDGEFGLWHLSNVGTVSWAELARAAARLVGLDADGVEGVPAHALSWRAQRPRFSALGSWRGAMLPSLDDALARYVTERGA